MPATPGIYYVLLVHSYDSARLRPNTHKVAGSFCLHVFFFLNLLSQDVFLRNFCITMSFFRCGDGPEEVSLAAKLLPICSPANAMNTLQTVMAYSLLAWRLFCSETAYQWLDAGYEVCLPGDDMQITALRHLDNPVILLKTRLQPQTYSKSQGLPSETGSNRIISVFYNCRSFFVVRKLQDYTTCLSPHHL